MSMCDGAPEIKHYELLEEIADDGIPEDAITEKLAEWDEDTHLHDYPGEIEIDEHYSEEYCELRSMGLTHPETMEAIKHEE